MANDLRYKIEHMGDSVVAAVARLTGCLQASGRGVRLTYDMGWLRWEKDRLIKKLGKRLVEIRKKSPEADVAGDPVISGLFVELLEIEERFESSRQRREERLEPWRFTHEPSC